MHRITDPPVPWLAGFASLAILVLGARAFLDPVAASAGFGLPMHTDVETTFVQIYGARNAFLGALALAFVAGRMIQPLRLLFAFATSLPLLDAVVIVSRIGVGQELIRHGAILIVLAIVSLSLWRSSGIAGRAVQTVGPSLTGPGKLAG